VNRTGFSGGLDQVEPTRVLGQELNLNLWPGEEHSLDRAALPRDQVVLDDELFLGGESLDHLFQELAMTFTISPSGDDERRITRGRLEGTVYPQMASPAVVGLEGGPLFSRYVCLTGVGLGRKWASSSIQITRQRSGGWR
jgi:hypothetical protein